jgi:hypothetical protein
MATARNYRFLFGRCVSAEAAAVFAAALDFGSRSTLAAALAAFLLVTSPEIPFFTYITRLSSYPHSSTGLWFVVDSFRHGIDAFQKPWS